MTTKNTISRNTEITSPNYIDSDRVTSSKNKSSNGFDAKVYQAGEFNHVGSISLSGETQKKGINDSQKQNLAGRSENPSGIRPKDESPWNDNEKAQPEDKMYVEGRSTDEEEVTQTENKEDNEEKENIE